MNETYDVVIVGGGPAGLNAALTLGRARRSVLVADAGEPRNAPAGHIHNYLGHEGTPPRQLLAIGGEEVAQYGVHVENAVVTETGREGDLFRVAFADGREVKARRLLVATGLVDELPDVPGLAERWGKDVLHCPYCHGWEVRDQPIGVLGDSPMATHMALLFRQWSDDVTLFLHTAPNLTAEQREQLDARGIRIWEEPVAGLEVTEGALSGVKLAGGGVVPVRALAVRTTLRSRTGFLAGLGLVPEQKLMGDLVVGDHLPVDPMGATSVPGVWAAGNAAEPFGQVIASAAAGLMAAAAVNNDLVTEDTERAVAARRAHGHGHGHGHRAQPEDVSQFFREDYWEDRYGVPESVWSGNPNAQLLTETAHLRPGTALEIGAGEGADAIWLAGRGWRVTAVDFAKAGLRKAADHAAARGVDGITWQHADITTWETDARFDLVTSHFFHLPAERFRRYFARIAALVAPGGTLLVVGHHVRDLDEPELRRPDFPDIMLDADRMAGYLDPDAWDLETVEARPRTAPHPETGEPLTLHDAVLRARRR